MLHVVMPSVISVDAVKSSIPISTNASRVPGHIVNLVFDKPEINEVAKADVSTDELLQTVTSVPYLYGQRNFSSTDLPAGFSNTSVPFAPFNEARFVGVEDTVLIVPSVLSSVPSTKRLASMLNLKILTHPSLQCTVALPRSIQIKIHSDSYGKSRVSLGFVLSIAHTRFRCGSALFAISYGPVF